MQIQLIVRRWKGGDERMKRGIGTNTKRFLPFCRPQPRRLRVASTVLDIFLCKIEFPSTCVVDGRDNATTWNHMA